MFQGQFEHTMDDKGRLAIPSPFRRKLGGEDVETTLMLTIADGTCLAAYPVATWEETLGQLAKLKNDPKVVQFKRLFVGRAHECQLDKAGRILLPADLRRDCGIERDTVLVGQLHKIEIWSAERWQQLKAQGADLMGSLYPVLADGGIQI